MKKSLLLKTFFVFFLFSIAGRVFAQSPVQGLAPGNKYFQTELLLDRAVLQPTNKSESPVARIGVLLKIEEGWHTYWQNSGEAALATKISWQIPEGWKVDNLNWPLPTKFIEKDGRVTYGYKHEVLLWANLFAPDVIPNETQKIKLSTRIRLLVCKDICVPGEQLVEMEIPFSETLAEEASDKISLFEKFSLLSARKIENIADLKNINITFWKEDYNNQQWLGFLIKNHNFKTVENLGTKIQVFPYFNSQLKVINADVRILQNSDILIAFKTEEKISADNQLSGVLSFSGDLLNSNSEAAIEWNLNLNKIGSGFFDLKTLATPAEKLTYRVIDNGEKPEVAKLKVEKSQTSLIIALLCAFFGGMILNLMPCVLPIISIKIMTFIGQANHSKKAVLFSCFSFAAGILCTFLVLSLIVIFLRLAGGNVGWGFQFQYPEFVFALLIIVFFLSLAFFDLYTINLPFLQSANQAATKARGTFAKNFFDGVLATALSTPCTAPFLGTALVFAFAQPPIVTVLLFQAIGLGLAFPYVYFSSRPKLMKLLPAPGDWMYHFRQFMGFLLLGTVCWLLFILNDLTQIGALWSLVILLVLYFCVWATKIIGESKISDSKKKIYQGLVLLLLLISGYFNYPKIVARKGKEVVSVVNIQWQEYSEEALQKAKANKKTVFIDFTASWCITCKFNEYRIIDTYETADAIALYDIVPLKADWTDGNEKITKALQSYGAEGVPLYVILSANQQEPIVLSTLPSQASLIEAFKKAAEKK